MKRKTLYKSAFIFAISYLSFGCTKIADINVSPNNPSLEAATPQVLIPSAVVSAAGRIGGELNILGGIWSQYLTQANASNQYKYIDSYNITRTDLNGNYNELFSGSLADLQLAINQSKASNKFQFLLMATVMKAYVYGVLVDLYDQVPYTEAFQGAANIQPKFNDGYTVYKGLLAEIDAALTTNYNVPLSAGDSKTDLIFGGDGIQTVKDEMDNWRRFANTLKLKMYLRMVNAKPAEAQAGVQALLQSNADFLTINAGPNTLVNSVRNSLYTDATNKRNPFYTYNIFALNTTTNLRASTTLVSLLKANSDPRLTPYFGTQNPTSMNQGDFNASLTAHPEYASATTPVQKPTDPVFFITAAESYFLQAEAALRFGAASNAQSLYNSGVLASFVQAGVAAGSLDPTATGSKYAFPSAGTTEQQIEAIITQKWLSFPATCHTLEGFFEQERTGYPKTSSVYSTDAAYVPGQWVYSPSSVTSGKFPKRLVYPDSERSRNSNTPAEVPVTTPVWWGK